MLALKGSTDVLLVNSVIIRDVVLVSVLVNHVDGVKWTLCSVSFLVYCCLTPSYDLGQK